MFKVSGLRRAGGERRKSLCQEAKARKSLQTLPQQEAACDYTGQQALQTRHRGGGRVCRPVTGSTTQYR